MLPFDLVFQDLARKEVRVIHVGSSDKFLFREFYCNEPGCDCRRVLFHVISHKTRKVAATINYSFEPATAPFEDEPQMFLDPLNPQSDRADELMQLFRGMIAGDLPYRERLIGHYEMWKRVVDDPSHPDHAKVRSEAHGDPAFRPAFRRGPAPPKAGANDPCPCGSGKKFKRCCRP